MTLQVHHRNLHLQIPVMHPHHDTPPVHPPVRLLSDPDITVTDPHYPEPLLLLETVHTDSHLYLI